VDASTSLADIMNDMLTLGLVVAVGYWLRPRKSSSR
jgi:hypothetical protein